MDKTRPIYKLITCHWMVCLGSLAITLGAVFCIIYFLFTLLFHPQNPYIGLLFLTVVTPLFLAGLGLIPLGLFFFLRQQRKGNPSLIHKSTTEILLNGSAECITGGKVIPRATALFISLTAIGLLVSGMILVGGLEYIDSSQFCGKLCHSVMEPEFVAYQQSPHANVSCVKCHIGPGLKGFTEASFNGAHQVMGIIRRNYNRPIPTPLNQLQPSKETCERCHWPNTQFNDKLKVITHFDEDRANTGRYTVLLLKLGGTRAEAGQPAGIHWHVGKEKKITYTSIDDKREEIDWIKLEQKVKPPVEYFYTGDDANPAGKLQGEDSASLRVMDCIDCHNRPSHAFQLPDQALDQLLVQYEQFQKIPFIKKTGLSILNRKFTEQQIKANAIQKAVLAWYQSKKMQPSDYDTKDLQLAANKIQAIYQRNVVPRMNLTWGTYSDHLGHTHSKGCMRCHTNELRTKKGDAVHANCNSCHTILAVLHRTPQVLTRFNMGGE